MFRFLYLFKRNCVSINFRKDKKEDISVMLGPFVRWAGGKRWFCNRIQEYLPTEFTDYYEPFLGGGSVYFTLYNKKLLKGDCFLSDLNTQLINAYKEVRDNPEGIVNWFQKRLFTEDEYYSIRMHYNSYPSSPTAPAEFLYLNKQGFNGIYRVNRHGDYNVPFGNKKVVSDDYYDLIRADSNALKGVNLQRSNYKYLLEEEIKPSSLVFIDPPYTTSHNNNGFISYNKKLFNLDDQKTLLRVLRKINESGAFFIMTNAHHAVIEKIFGEFKLYEETRQSLIGGKNAVRQPVKEYVVCNFDIGARE